MKTKTYYQQLKKPILGYVKAYVTDFTVEDKKLLRGYKGKFISAIRESGTDICLFEKVKDYDIDQIRGLRSWLFTYNKRFFIGDNGTVTEVNKDVALSEYNDFVSKICEDSLKEWR